MNVKDLITEDVPQKAHYIVVELTDGSVYTLEADTTEQLHKKVSELEIRAKSEGLKIVQ